MKGSFIVHSVGVELKKKKYLKKMKYYNRSIYFEPTETSSCVLINHPIRPPVEEYRVP